MEDSMTATETARAIDWAISHGHSYEEAVELVNFIAGYIPQKQASEESTQQQDK